MWTEVTYQWPEALACPICNAGANTCIHTRDTAYHQALVLNKLLQLTYQSGKPITIRISGTHEIYHQILLGTRLIAEGDGWEEKVMQYDIGRFG